MKIFICLLSICFSTALFSQRGETEEIEEYPVQGDSEISVSVGLFTGSLSDGGFGPEEDTDYLRKAGFAVAYDYYFSETWSIKGKLLYDPKGATSDSDDSKLEVDYITLPVLANWHFGKRKRWYLHFGPAVSFLLAAESSSGGSSLDVKELFNNSQFGFDFGIGVKIPIGGLMFFIESDAMSDFSSPINDSNVVGTPDDSRLTRSALSIGVIF